MVENYVMVWFVKYTLVQPFLCRGCVNLVNSYYCIGQHNTCIML